MLDNKTYFSIQYKVSLENGVIIEGVAFKPERLEPGTIHLQTLDEPQRMATFTYAGLFELLADGRASLDMGTPTPAPDMPIKPSSRP